jgi:hypothetical protein
MNTLTTIPQYHYHRDILISGLHEWLEQLDQLDRLNLLSLLSLHLTYDAYSKSWGAIGIDLDYLTAPLEPTVEFSQVRSLLEDLELKPKELIPIIRRLTQQISDVLEPAS